MSIEEALETISKYIQGMEGKCPDSVILAEKVLRNGQVRVENRSRALGGNFIPVTLTQSVSRTLREISVKETILTVKEIKNVRPWETDDSTVDVYR